MNAHGPENAVPPLDEVLARILDEPTGIGGILVGGDQIRDGILNVATSRLTTDQTQTFLAAIPEIVLALGQLGARLTNPESNPCLRELSIPTQKEVQHLGEQYRDLTCEYAPHQEIAEAAALIAGE